MKNFHIFPLSFQSSESEYFYQIIEQFDVKNINFKFYFLIKI